MVITTRDELHYHIAFPHLYTHLRVSYRSVNQTYLLYSIVELIVSLNGHIIG